MRIALIGCGAISTTIAQAIKNKELDIVLKYVFARRADIAKEFANRFGAVYLEFDEILDKDLDLIVEAASQEAVRTLIPRSLKAKKNVMIMSNGALVDESLLQEIKDLARKNNLKVYLPSGAIAGLDGVKAARIGRIERVTLKTRKPPKSLKGAPFFDKSPVDLEAIESSTIIFEGSADEAARLFPANLNIAATLGMAGIGPRGTNVQIVVDPDVEFNIHEITVEGSFGIVVAKTQNAPSFNNPRTSDLAALSAVATLKRIAEPIEVGT